MLYGADCGWWHYYSQAALAFPGLKVTASDGVTFRAVYSLRVSGLVGFDPDPAAIRTGGNSAYQATHIAAQAGATRILLCGVDLHSRGGDHHHGPHPPGLRNTDAKGFRDMLKRWQTLAAPLAALGVEVINCSPGSALECFPRQRIEEALCARSA